MTLKDTAENYGSIAKWLHWLTALLILASYGTYYYRHWFTENRTPENWNVLQLHLSGGNHCWGVGSAQNYLAILQSEAKTRAGHGITAFYGTCRAS